MVTEEEVETVRETGRKREKERERKRERKRSAWVYRGFESVSVYASVCKSKEIVEGERERVREEAEWRRKEVAKGGGEETRGIAGRGRGGPTAGRGTSET